MKLFKICKKTSGSFCDIYGGDRYLYQARHIIMNQLGKPLDGGGISADSNAHVHLICVGDDPLMLSIARQVMLVCHFPNFNENSGEFRTKVTFIIPGMKNHDDFHKGITSDDRFGNLFSVCKWDANQVDSDSILISRNPDSFIDMEVEILGFNNSSVEDYLLNLLPEEGALTTIVFHQGSVSDKSFDVLCGRFYQVHAIDKSITNEKNGVIPMEVDIRMARYANIVYYKGRADRNLSNENLSDIKTYCRKLKRLIKRISHKEEYILWDKLMDAHIISNVCCTDCFNYYLKSVGYSHGNKPDYRQIEDLLRKNIGHLSRTEHARWNVEKLIMGFRPLTPEESLTDENVSGAERLAYRNKLKGDKIHIDICSMARLRCIDPDSLKYDAFPILAIPYILKQVDK